MSHHELAAHDQEMDHGTVKSYALGITLSVVLTLIAFWLVGYKVLPEFELYISLSVLALLQLFVQMVFFLHLSTKSSARWNLLAFLFTIFVVAVLVGGSLWIMYNLDYNMMH